MKKMEVFFVDIAEQARADVVIKKAEEGCLPHFPSVRRQAIETLV